ncbi:MAG TPA: M28 family peptidase [Planctomycetota bacterium]|nr:M28 family peptidase [Planctomycetota bacterium]
MESLRILLAVLLVQAPATVSPEAARATGFATITEEDVGLHLRNLAAMAHEGRDSPSAGLTRAARYISERFGEAGCEFASGESFLWPFSRSLPAPVAAECALSLAVEGAEPRTFELGRDFVPLAGCGGTAEGELVFLGFGINSKREHFTEVDGRLSGKIALILWGEPRHAKRFDGPEESPDASLWAKLETLREAKLAGVILARRPPDPPKKASSEERELPELSFRHTWATWTVERMRTSLDDLPRDTPPTIEVTLECASELLGEDVAALAERGDRTVRPLRRDPRGRVVRLASRTETREVPIDNVVALLRGSDPELAGEFVVIGAHYDHVGVDERGRIGYGADDNASGTAALIELAQAFSAARPRRSLLLAAFAAEEDGLLGSDALCKTPPVPLDSMVAMINMDMLGRGDAGEVAVIGIVQNPQLEKILDRGKRLARTGVKRVVVRQGEELFQRSDHYSFHQVGVPVLFFFEGLPIEKNPDYHTWRDTIERLDTDKITRTTRLVFNCAWLLASDDERPPAPRE